MFLALGKYLAQDLNESTTMTWFVMPRVWIKHFKLVLEYVCQLLQSINTEMKDKEGDTLAIYRG